jgi:hypothetical protein
VQDTETEQCPGAQGQKRTKCNTAENFHELAHRVLMVRNLSRASFIVKTTADDCAFIFTSLTYFQGAVHAASRAPQGARVQFERVSTPFCRAGGAVPVQKPETLEGFKPAPSIKNRLNALVPSAGTASPACRMGHDRRRYTRFQVA